MLKKNSNLNFIAFFIQKQSIKKTNRIIFHVFLSILYFFLVLSINFSILQACKKKIHIFFFNNVVKQTSLVWIAHLKW